MPTGVQMNRTATGVVLPKEVSTEIWQDAIAESAVMRFANRIDLPGAGVQIPMITGDPEATWVTETSPILVGEHTLDSKSIMGYKVGVIELFSNEFKRDLPRLYAALASRLPKSIGQKFDETVFHGTAPGSDFDVLTDVDGLPLDSATAYDNLVAVEAAIAEANGVNSGYVLAPRARGVLLSAKDGNDRPLLINDLQREGGVPQLLGAPVSLSRAVYRAGDAEDEVAETLGFAGDWSQAMYGVVEDIEVAISTEASVSKGGTQVNLFQQDMFAVRVTAHLGFGVRDKSKFVRLTGETPEA